MQGKTVHLGRNIKRIREIQGIKQEALALELGSDWNQKKVSLLESKEMVDDELLKQAAIALKTTPEVIRNYSDEGPLSILSHPSQGNTSEDNNSVLTFNLMDKWIEAMEENKKLYERLLQSEREKVELLEKVLELRK